MFLRWFSKREKKIESIIKPIFNLQLDLTYECNLCCQHCYQQKGFYTNRELSLDEWEGVLEQFYKLTSKLDVTPAIIISGGEPLMSPIWQTLVNFIRKNKPSISICFLTNGTLINEESAAFLKDNNVEVQISLDGPTPEYHNYFRGNGSYESSIEGAKMLRKFGVPFSFQAVLQKSTTGVIANFFELALSLGATSMDFARLIPASENYKHEKEIVAGQDLKNAYQQIWQSSCQFNMPTSTHRPLWCLIDSSLGHPCSAGFLGMTISPNGLIQLTSRIFKPVGNAIEENGIEKTYFDSLLFKKLRAGEINGCSKCEFFKRCRGDRNVSYTICGDFFGPDEHCWHWQEHVRARQLQ